jgi:hypothetical protein
MKLLHDPKKPDAEHALKYWLDRSQCVSTDDPRLKEKIGAEICHATTAPPSANPPNATSSKLPPSILALTNFYAMCIASDDPRLMER